MAKKTHIYHKITFKNDFENHFKKSSDTYQVLPQGQALNDFRVRFSYDLINGKGGVINDYKMSIGINESSIPFVLPNYGLYEFSCSGEILINMPVTPLRSIIFIPDDSQFILKNDTSPFYFIEDELSLIHISEPTRHRRRSRMPSSA